MSRLNAEKYLFISRSMLYSKCNFKINFIGRTIMYKLNIKDRVDAKFDKINQFAVAIGISHAAAEKLYNGETVRIAFDTLEAICDEFHCTPNDLFTKDDIPISRLDNIPDPFDQKYDGKYKVVEATIVPPSNNMDYSAMSQKLINSIADMDNTIKQATALKNSFLCALDVFRDSSMIKNPDSSNVQNIKHDNK